jgi:hypothetical protein
LAQPEGNCRYFCRPPVMSIMMHATVRALMVVQAEPFLPAYPPHALSRCMSYGHDGFEARVSVDAGQDSAQCRRSDSGILGDDAVFLAGSVDASRSRSRQFIGDSPDISAPQESASPESLRSRALVARAEASRHSHLTREVDECVFEEVRKPLPHARADRRLLQLLSRVRSAERLRRWLQD